MSEPGTEAVAIGSVVMQILVEWRSNCVFNGGLDAVSGKTGAGALAQACGSAAPFTWPVSELGNPGTSANSCKRTLAKSSTFPVLPVGMAMPR